MFLMQWLARTFGSSFPAVLAEFQDSRIFNASNTHQFLLPTKDGHRLTNDRLVWSSSKERRESCICILLAEKAFLYAEPPTKRLGVYVFGETNSVSYLGTRGHPLAIYIGRPFDSEQNHRRSFVTFGQAVGAVICGSYDRERSLSFLLPPKRKQKGTEVIRRRIDESITREPMFIASKYRDDESASPSLHEAEPKSSCVVRDTSAAGLEKPQRNLPLGKTEGVADG